MMFFMKRTALCILGLCMLISPTFAYAGSPAVISVGQATFTADDVLKYLLKQSNGDNLALAACLQQSTADERKKIVNNISDVMVFSEAAKAMKLDKRPDIAYNLKWQTMQILLQAYLQNASTRWDMGDRAQKRYYETHLFEFVQSAAAQMSKWFFKDKNAAEEAILQYNGTNKIGEMSCVAKEDLGWVEIGTMPASFNRTISEAPAGAFLGPYKFGSNNWAIYQIVGKRKAKQLSFTEAEQEVIQRMQIGYIKDELEKLKKKYRVVINKKELFNICGVYPQIKK